MTSVTVREEAGKFKVFDDSVCFSVEQTKEEAEKQAALLRDYYIFSETVEQFARELLEKRTPEQRAFIKQLTLGTYEIEI